MLQLLKLAFAFPACLGAFGAGLTGCAKSTAGETKNPVTAEVQSGDFRVVVTATGKVVANREVQVSSKASGEIIELPFEAGDIVTTGQLLVRLDPDDERRNVRNMEFELKSAEARREKAKRELRLGTSAKERTGADAEASVEYCETKLAEAEARHKRNAKLFESNLIPKEDLDSSLTALQQARTDLTRARATAKDSKSMEHMIATREQDIKLAEVEVGRAEVALEQARKRLADTEVVATMDGTITERKVERGQVISSAMTTVGGGTVLLVLSDLSKIFVVAEVDESDIGGIELNQRATITADSFPGRRFEGHVHHIAPIGVEKNSVVSFNVKVEVEGEGIRKLRPGMTADVEILTAEANGTLWVQSGAIEEDGDARFVELVDPGGQIKRVSVEIGISDGLYTEIRKGLSAGAKVVIPEVQTESSLGRRGPRRTF